MKVVNYKRKVTGYLFLVTLLCSSTSSAIAQSFNIVGCKPPYETLYLGDFNDELIYSRGKEMMCGVTINGVGRWNGSFWSSFGIGIDQVLINGPFLALTKYNNDLYLGGHFLTIGGKTTNKIARWNGLQWDSVGKGLDEQLNGEKIKALAVYKNELYAAGRFRQVDGVSGYQNIAVWNGNNWRKIGGLQGSIPWVECMAVYKNELYVGGVFARAGFTNASFIARWNGQEWNTVGKGTNARVLSMVVDTIQNVLYVTGEFNAVHDTIKCQVAKWDGNQWSAVGDDKVFPSSIGALEMYHGYLYAGGSAIKFDQRETLFARWDGNNWEPIPGIDGPISSLKTYNDELYLGGGFTKINNDSIPYLARYYSPDSVIIGVNHDTKTKHILKVYPNPVENTLNIESDLTFMKYIIYSTEGRLVLEVKNPKFTSINISELKKGNYILKAFTESNKEYVARFLKD